MREVTMLCHQDSLAWATPMTVGPEHMTEFRGDAGSEFPLLHTGLCPDREENHHHAADSLSPELYNMLESLGDTRIPWPTANWPVPRDQPALTAELWTWPPVWRNQKQSWTRLLMLPWEWQGWGLIFLLGWGPLRDEELRKHYEVIVSKTDGTLTTYRNYLICPL